MAFLFVCSNQEAYNTIYCRLLTSMSATEILHKPIIDVRLEPAQEGQMIVHCSYRSNSEGGLIRIWKTTYLKAAGTSQKATLVHAEGITMYPQWLMIPPNTKHVFTLIFTPLPKSVRQFDLIEDIPQEGGFEVRNIPRNSTDVYRVSVD